MSNENDVKVVLPADDEIGPVLAVANVNSLVKETLTKIGLEFLAPLKPDVLDEKVAKAVTQNGVKKNVN